MVQYVVSSFEELKNNVTWPTMAELQSSTVIVSVASVIISLLIYVMDQGVNTVLESVYSLQ